MIAIRQATSSDVGTIHDMLIEAAAWVDALGVVMWEGDELEFEPIVRDVAAGQFYVAEVDNRAAGAIRFQTEDLLFWPDLPQSSSAFVHRLVVRRGFRGQNVSTALLDWAVGHARDLGKAFLRLDCDNDRPKLKALYERFGFTLHSYRQVGPYYVARYEYRLT